MNNDNDNKTTATDSNQSTFNNESSPLEKDSFERQILNNNNKSDIIDKTIKHRPRDNA